MDGTYQKEQTYNLEYRGRNVGFIDKIDANVFQINTDDTKPPKGAPSPKAQASGTAQGGVPIGQLELSKIKATGANLNLASSFGDGHMVKYGVNYRHETSEPSDKGAWLKILGLYDRDKEKKAEYGVYAEGIWNLNPRYPDHRPALRPFQIQRRQQTKRVARSAQPQYQRDLGH